MRRHSRLWHSRRVWLVTASAAAVFITGFGTNVRTQNAPGAAAPPPAAQGAGANGRGARAGAPGGAPDSTASDFTPTTPYLPRTAAEEAKGFRLPTGYRLELVASDPDIISPAAIEFDGNGRMYVAELIGYMQDAEASQEHDPVSRISRWESTKGDGHYDKHTVFADHLVAPRMILPLTDGVILTSETDSDEVIKLSDTNGDGVADKREVVFTGIGQSGDANIEHQKAGLLWNMDNWIYTTYNAFRIRWTPNGFLREPTGANGGQWGLSHDDDGKPWFVDAGGERGPMNFQFPIVYGAFTPCAPARGNGGFGARGGAITTPPERDANCPAGMDSGFEDGFATVWPAPGIADMQGGLGRTRMPAGNLNHFTAATGPTVVRGDRLPDDLKGDLLFTEPVGRLIRRAKIVDVEGLTELRNAYPQAEFLTSDDQLFRPVNITNAPDGTVFIADMYHGIIQEREWSGPGSYLRAKIEQYQLDKVVNHGRIWRLRYDGRAAVPATDTNIGQAAIPAIEPNFANPHMYGETPAQLVAHLTSENGWYRDTAQRLIVLSQDKSVVPALQQMTRSSNNLLARFHALWSLEGLGALDASLAREEMKDPNPRMRIQAIRASETLYKAGDKTFADDYRALTKDGDYHVVIQAMLTLNLFKVDGVADVIKAVQAAHPEKGVQLIAKHLLTPPAANNFGGVRGGLTPEQQKLMEQGGEVFNAVCFSCHGNDGRGRELAGGAPGALMAPPLAGSPRVQGHKDYVIRVLLNGLTGPLNDRTYSEVMVPMGANNDEWIAGIASYVRNSFGNASGMVSPADVARVRADTAKRKTMWTMAEAEAGLPHALDTTGIKLSASHNAEAVDGAFTLRGWNAGAPQASGMWFQIELPQAAMVTEVQFDSTAARAGRGGFGGGRGGRGGRGAAPAGAAEQAPAAAPGAPGAPGANRGGFGQQQPPPTPTSPKAYTVTVSTDGKTWSKPVLAAQGEGNRTDARFAPVRAKFVRITLTESAADVPNWSINGLKVYEAAK